MDTKNSQISEASVSKCRKKLMIHSQAYLFQEDIF